MSYTLHLGDCLEVMPGIPAGSVDAIIADWPYGTTACKWDSVIPLEPLWKECKRVIKPKGAIVLTAASPFNYTLWASNPKWFKYEWVWNKQKAGNFAIAKNQPLRIVENILVFCQGSTAYNPQMMLAKPENKRPRDRGYRKKTDLLNGFKANIFISDKNHNEDYRYPINLLDFKSTEKECNSINRLHPTQKPVALMEYLIKTYTNPGDLVLDNTMGSGSTGEACLNTGRRFIGIEKDEGYFEIAKNRLERVERELRGEQLEMAI